MVVVHDETTINVSSRSMMEDMVLVINQVHEHSHDSTLIPPNTPELQNIEVIWEMSTAKYFYVD